MIFWKERELHPQEDNEEIFDPEISYLSAIGAIIFLVNYTWFDMAFWSTKVVKIGILGKIVGGRWDRGS